MQNIIARELRKSYDEGRSPHIVTLRLFNMQCELAELDYDEERSSRLNIIVQRMYTVPLVVLHPETT